MAAALVADAAWRPVVLVVVALSRREVGAGMIMAISYCRISPISLASSPNLADGGTRTLKIKSIRSITKEYLKFTYNCKGLAEEGHAKANEGTDHDVGGQAGTLSSVG